MTFVGPTVLEDVHELSEFESASPVLNDWLKKRARRNDRLNFSRVFVVCPEATPTVIAYYCLSAASIQRDLLPKSLRRNAPDPIPAVVLGRLAVDRRYEGRGLGRDLVKHAVAMTAMAEGRSKTIASVPCWAVTIFWHLVRPVRSRRWESGRAIASRYFWKGN